MYKRQVSTALSAFVESEPVTLIPSTPIDFALIESIVTEILFSLVVSAPTWKLNSNALEPLLNAVSPDAYFSSFDILCASFSTVFCGNSANSATDFMSFPILRSFVAI